MVFRASLEKKGEKERVRAELMRAALRLGAQHGFASLGLREVAREAGIAPTSFYRHFSDMEELGMAIIRELAGPVLRSWGAAAAAGGDMAAALVDAMLTAAAHDPQLARFIVMERVGAFSGFRALLRAELLQVSAGLQGARSALDAATDLPPWAAETVMVVLMDGCLRALDDAPSRLPGLCAGLVQSIGQLLRAQLPAAGEVSR